MIRMGFKAVELLLAGVAIGLLVAPRSGAQTRRLLGNKGASWARHSLGAD